MAQFNMALPQAWSEESQDLDGRWHLSSGGLFSRGHQLKIRGWVRVWQCLHLADLVCYTKELRVSLYWLISINKPYRSRGMLCSKRPGVSIPANVLDKDPPPHYQRAAGEFGGAWAMAHFSWLITELTLAIFKAREFPFWGLTLPPFLLAPSLSPGILAVESEPKELHAQKQAEELRIRKSKEAPTLLAAASGHEECSSQ